MRAAPIAASRSAVTIAKLRQARRTDRVGSLSLQVQRGRASRLLGKSEKQIPRGLKPARDDKNKRLNGASKDAPLQGETVKGVLQQPAMYLA